MSKSTKHENPEVPAMFLSVIYSRFLYLLNVCKLLTQLRKFLKLCKKKKTLNNSKHNQSAVVKSVIYFSSAHEKFCTFCSGLWRSCNHLSDCASLLCFAFLMRSFLFFLPFFPHAPPLYCFTVKNLHVWAIFLISVWHHDVDGIVEKGIVLSFASGGFPKRGMNLVWSH